MAAIKLMCHVLAWAAFLRSGLAGCKGTGQKDAPKNEGASEVVPLLTPGTTPTGLDMRVASLPVILTYSTEAPTLNPLSLATEPWFLS